MALVDVARLSAALAGDAPCGDNVEYDPAFADLAASARQKPDVQKPSSSGLEIIPGDPPDWRVVLDKAQKLCERTRDLRVGVILATALLARGGFPGLRDGLSILRAWHDDPTLLANVHPSPADVDEPDASEFRCNALADLSNYDNLDVVQTRKVARLTSVATGRRAGKTTLLDLLVLDGRAKYPPTSDGSTPAAPNQDAIAAVFADAASAGDLAAQSAAVDGSLEDLAAIKASYSGSGLTPDLAALEEDLRRAQAEYRQRSVFAATSDQAAAGEPKGGISDAGGSGGSSAAPGVGEAPVAGGSVAAPGPLRAREQLLLQIDEACRYYESHERSNLAPVFLLAAKRLMSLNGSQVYRVVSPDLLAQVEKVAGLGEDGRPLPPPENA